MAFYVVCLCEVKAVTMI